MKGMTIQLAVETITGYDAFNAPIITEQLIDVPDCLVGQPTTDDITNSISLYGKKIAYVIGIPKGDQNNWVDATVIINGNRFKTIGYPEEGIQENIPLRWGKNVKVERYG